MRVRDTGALGLAWGLSGCVLITGGTSGYVPADAGAADAMACAGDATCLGDGCRSAANCTGEAGGPICCLMPTSSGGVAATCTSEPCLGIQLCQTSTECLSGTQCVPQICTFGAFTVSDIQACGTLASCSPQ